MGGTEVKEGLRAEGGWGEVTQDPRTGRTPSFRLCRRDLVCELGCIISLFRIKKIMEAHVPVLHPAISAPVSREACRGRNGSDACIHPARPS